MVHTTIPSPVGALTLTGDGEALSGVFMHEHRHRPPLPAGAVRDDRAFPAARAQLDAYFAGDLRAFDVPLAVAGTPFQRAVWEALLAVPYGETISYGDLARRVGRPGAARAVGLANGRNPVSIIVPCHRVIGASGSLTGYGGGLDRKQALLRFEAAVLQHGPQPLTLAAGSQPSLFGGASDAALPSR
jgi:methylated-DNA-[protein]-cysteine S-methyltransferase